MRKVIIVGGGLAGLVVSIKLRKSGLDPILIEKKTYPFHRVCGEYISNEVRPFLEELSIYPDELGASDLHTFQLTSVSGKEVRLSLEMGGFGISRYSLDQHLYNMAQAMGVEMVTGKSVMDLKYEQGHFDVELAGGEVIQSELVVGAFGKRSRLDQVLNRSFFKKRSPYIGVKYHISNIDQPDHLISLHNFKNGYCGLSKIEGDKYNMCYLTARKNLETSITEMEQTVLSENPFLKKIFQSANFLLDKPLVINEISFETKEPVQNHILMCGDAAGMITPLCGNGMAMAIHSAKILAEQILKYHKDNDAQGKIEQAYSKAWTDQFSKRLWKGRQIQKLFGSKWLSDTSVSLVNKSDALGKYLVKQTHGEYF